MLRPFRRHADFFRRFLAGGTAALVLALGMFAASPVLHDRLHCADEDVASNDHGCAVVLFASGVSVPFDPIAIAPPSAAWREWVRPGVPEIFLVSPRYLRQPERGPPFV